MTHELNDQITNAYTRAVNVAGSRASADYPGGRVMLTVGRANKLANSDMPEECPACSSQTVRIVWNCVLFSPEDIDKPDVQTGAMLIGSQVDFERTVPDRVCLTCQPKWSDVHALAVRDCQLQIAKSNAIDAQDFDKARQMRDLQFDFRPKLNAMVDRLLP